MVAGLFTTLDETVAMADARVIVVVEADAVVLLVIITILAWAISFDFVVGAATTVSVDVVDLLRVVPGMVQIIGGTGAIAG